ncbi:MAG: MFS transporter [Bacillota bacterium]|nr:MFS transporter [Bacillota bacterium]
MVKKGLLATSIAHSYNDMYFYLFPLLMPLFRMEFALNYTQVGIVMTVFMAIIALFTSIWGSLGDKYDHHRVLSLGFVIATVGLLAVTLPTRFAWVVLFVALTGIGVSTFHPLATAMISFSISRPGFSMGVFEGSGTLGGIFATVVMSLLISSWGWRWTVVLLALPGLLLAFIFYRKVTIARVPNHAQTVQRPTALRVLMLFFTGRTLRGLAAGAVISFLPSYILEAWQLNPSTGSIIYATFFVGGLIGAVYLGHLADRISHILLVTITTLMPVLLIITVTLPVSLPFGVLILLLIGACFTGFYPPHNRWIAEGITQEQRGKYFGIGMTLETLAFAVAPGIFGFLADRAGLVTALRSTTSIWLIAGVFFTLVLIKSGHSRHLRDDPGGAHGCN